MATILILIWCSLEKSHQGIVYVRYAIARAKDEHRTLSLSPLSAAQKRKVSKISTIGCDNSETVRDRMSVTINH